MYKIGDFSKITNLTVKTLRYYDEQNILIPSYRDDENSYRYYGEKDFEKAQFIATLRAFDFSISEIKDILGNCESPDDLSFYLEEKKIRIEKTIAKEKELIAKMNLYIKPMDKEEIGMDYKIEEKVIPAITVASIRFKGKYSDVGKYIGEIYKAVKNCSAGAPFNCYFDMEFKDEADIELCVPTTQLISDHTVSAKKLPAVKAICTVHRGSYEKLNLAYKALLDYAGEHHLNCLTPTREVYLKGPGMIFKGNENNYLTEIILPYEEIQP